MLQNQIEVVLVYVEYTGKIMDHGERAIKTFEEIEQDDYPGYVKLGQWRSGGELIVQPYLKVKRNGKICNVEIAVKVCKEREETVEKITFAPAGYAFQRYKEKDDTYFLPPNRWKKNQYGNIIRTIEGHYVKIGHETIKISFQDGRTETMLLKSEYQEEQKKFYADIILDLLSLDRRLCTDNDSPTSMSAILKDDLYDDTKKMVDDFCKAYEGIEKNAQAGLKFRKQKKPFHKVRKISPQALVEHEIFHKDKVRTVSYVEDFDIYEHRVIKTQINRLKDLIEIRKQTEQMELEREAGRLKNRLSDFSRLGEEDEKKFQESITQIKKQLKKEQEEIEALLDNPCRKPPLKAVRVEFKVLEEKDFGGEDFKWEQGKKKDPHIYINKCVKSDRKQGMANGCQYEAYEEGLGWTKKNYDEKGIQTQFITIRIGINCKDAAAKIYYSLYSKHRNIRKNDKVTIHGMVDENYSAAQGSYAKYEFRFYEISEIRINGERIIIPDSCMQEYRDYVCKLYINGTTAKESSKFYEEIDNLRRRLAEITQKLDAKEERGIKWAALYQKLLQKEKSALMNQVKDVRACVRMTNLFAFHPAYQKMYSVITAENKRIERIEYYSQYHADDLPIAKLPDLYEVWCCIKLVWQFAVDYGFKIQQIRSGIDGTGIDSLREYIRQIFMETETLSGSRFDLKGIVGGKDMTVTIWYDQQIEIDKEKLKDVFVKEKSKLTPDILMRICYAGRQRLFVMDAKNKGPGHDYVQDICEVAFQKYTLELGLGMKENEEFHNERYENSYVDGSFILWPSMDRYGYKVPVPGKAVKVGYPSESYLGAFPKLFMDSHTVLYEDKSSESKDFKIVVKKEGWLDTCKQKKWKVHVGQLSKWSNAGDENKNGCNENRIGIIAVSPKENDLNYLLQMIMEKHFGLYKEKCWLCGRDYGEDEIEEGTTKGGYRKFRIECKNKDCGAVTIETHCWNMKNSMSKLAHKNNRKLGKHLVNYYAQSDSEKKECKWDIWNVSCPICRALAEGGDTEFGQNAFDPVYSDQAYLEPSNRELPEDDEQRWDYYLRQIN